MIQNVLQHIGGIEGYGVISLCLFGTLFLGLAVWAMAQRKTHLDRMARLPLEDENDTRSNV